MTIAQGMLPEFDSEMKGFRKIFAAVPESRHDFTPHPKSFTLGQLAMHTANMISWIPTTLTSPDFDMAPPGQEPYKTPPFTTTAALLAEFEKNAAAARAAIATVSDEMLLGSFTLKRGGEPIFSQPRIALMRGMFMNHLIHHRGQLTVYLRMVDVPVPAMYGNSADDRGGMG